MPAIRRSPKAKVDYLDIWLYVAQKSGSVDIAQGVTDQFDEHLKMLSIHPGMGTARDDLVPGLRTFPVGSYLILFRPIKGGIEVVRVVHGARELRKVLGLRRRR